MINLNTNLSSIITQRSLATSTQRLNQAIEQMTTGFKINHAKDNAANYNITTNMTTKIGAYMVAEDNCAMGLDLLATANGSLDQISDKLQRLRALAVQTSNGTYGEKSKEAINQEANAIVDEIERIYGTSQYNGISLYDQTKGAGCDMESLPTVGPSGFIKEVKKRDTSNMTTLAGVDGNVALTSGTYSISTPEELAKLATMTNNGLIGKDTEFVLANDIDLIGYANWTPIGYYNNSNSKPFLASFDGNGYKVFNIKISSVSSETRGFGLFGFALSAKISNLSVEGVANVRFNVGILIGQLSGANALVENCYSSGSIEAYGTSGGLVGNTPTDFSIENIRIKDCYSNVSINAISESTGTYANFGGLVGNSKVLIENCFAAGDVLGSNNNFNLGGLCGISCGEIKNCYSTGNVTGYQSLAGLVAWSHSDKESYEALIENCYSSGTMTLLGRSSTGIIAVAAGILGYGRGATVRNCTSESKIVNLGSDPFRLSAITENKGEGENSTYTVDVSNCLYNSLINPDIIGVGGFGTFQNIFDVSKISSDINLGFQIGIDSEESSSINLTSSFKLGGLYSLRSIGLDDSDYLTKIDSMLGVCSAKSTEYGAMQNRLESALDEISVQYENLVSSRSTLRDADISEVSSEYIRQQILQQASATLMATANQSPSIALQLI